MYEHYYKGQLVDTQGASARTGLSVWDVFEEYADVRDDLEDILDGFHSIIEDIGLAIYELEGGLEDVEEHLARCDKVFRRFTAKRRREEKKFELKHRDEGEEEREELPFDDLPASDTEPSSLM